MGGAGSNFLGERYLTYYVYIDNGELISEDTPLRLQSSRQDEHYTFLPRCLRNEGNENVRRQAEWVISARWMIVGLFFLVHEKPGAE